MTDGHIPTPNELESSLETALLADLSVPTEESLTGPILSDPFLDELDLADDPGTQEGLPYLVRLAEQYPGLKITLSFG